MAHVCDRCGAIGPERRLNCLGPGTRCAAAQTGWHIGVANHLCLLCVLLDDYQTLNRIARDMIPKEDE